MKLLIIGAGGYGRLVREIAELNGYDSIDFLDDNSELAVAKVDELDFIQKQYDGAIVAIGNPEVREKIYKRIAKPVSVVHPSAFISKSAVVGNGCVIEANAVINSETIVKNGTFICSGAVVNHNSVVNEFCQIDCNAVVAAGANVPAGTKLFSCTVWNIKTGDACW